MSKQPSDSFLPSGAIENPRKSYLPYSSMVSPLSQIPRSVPTTTTYNLSPLNSAEGSPTTQSFSPLHRTPISPPKSRSGSAEESTAALVEDYRQYTDKIRLQFKGERAHILADRARMEETMEDERKLWSEERTIWVEDVRKLKERNAYLEAQLRQATSNGFVEEDIPQMPMYTTQNKALRPPLSRTASTESSVPQESGRTADGRPFYAPAPRNPSRTFGESEGTDMKIGDVTMPKDAIQVTNKELTQSDFGPQNTARSPPQGRTAPWNGLPAIGIELVMPQLDGINLKASAVAPQVVAQILNSKDVTPNDSPAKSSPTGNVPPRDVTNMHRHNSEELKKRKTLEVATTSETRRLTLHAGHTPSHSTTNFSLLGITNESGNATPTQEKHDQLGENRRVDSSIFLPGYSETSAAHNNGLSIVPGCHEPPATHNNGVGPEDDDQGDRALSGILGITKDTASNDEFTSQLIGKLEQVARSQNSSPSNSSEVVTHPQNQYLSPPSIGNDDEDEDEDDEDSVVEMPRLRLKQSVNFGKPFGNA